MIKKDNVLILARDLGAKHRTVTSLTNRLGDSIVKKLREDSKIILSYYEKISKRERHTLLTAADKWLIENSTIVLDDIHSVGKTFSRQFIPRLPTTRIGKNQIRIFAALTCLITDFGFQVNQNRIWKFVEEYQKETELTIAELWSTPLILRVLLIKGLSKSLTDEKVIKDVILGLRNLKKIDWGSFVEEVSLVDKILRREVGGIYALMDFRTRDSYRHVIEEIYFQTRVPQTEISRWVVEESKKKRCHIGYYLLGPGRDEISQVFLPKRKLHEKFSLLLQRRPIKIYFGLVLGITLVIFIITLRIFGLSVWLLLLLLPSCFDLARTVAYKVIVKLYPPNYLPKMDSTLPVAEINRTIVLTPTILTTGTAEINKMFSVLEENFLANRGSNIFFGLALSWPKTIVNQGKPTPQEIENLEIAKKRIVELNRKYPAAESNFHLFFRERKWSQDEQGWVEWERKRGKIMDFVHYLRNPTSAAFSYSTAEKDFLAKIKYVIVVDDDVTLPRDTARKLIATMIHPLNAPIIDSDRGVVVRGYGIIQPRISTEMTEGVKTLKDYIFGGDFGWDPYSNVVSDVYQDVFRESFFMGRGIIDVDVFDKILVGRLPENVLLSHDHIEGFYCRTGFVSDVTIFESVPATYSSYCRRLHRWVRGDWQRLFWILPKIVNEKGEKEDNPLSIFQKWKLVEDLIQYFNYPATIALVFSILMIIPQKQVSALIFLLLVFWINPILSLLRPVSRYEDIWASYRHNWLVINERIKNFLAKATFNLVFSVDYSLVVLSAIVTALGRVFVTKRRRLEWETFNQTNQYVDNYTLLNGLWESRAEILIVSVLLVIVMVVMHGNYVFIPLCLLVTWLMMPLFIVRINRRLEKKRQFSDNEEQNLRIIARRTWRYFDDLVTKNTNYLPPDHFQKTTLPPISTRTSATDIGMYLTSLVAIYDLNFITRSELVDRLTKTAGTLKKLELLHGHFFNWYDIKTLKVLPPSYVSTVDSGNLACALLVAAKALDDTDEVAEIGYKTIRALDDLLCMVKGEAEPVLTGQLRIIQTKISNVNPKSLQEWERHLDYIQKEVGGIEVEEENELGYWLVKFKELLEADIQQLRSGDIGKNSRKLAKTFEILAMNMDFIFLYDTKRNLFRIGYSQINRSFDKGHYDLLASEARMASFFAIAKNDVPIKHWTTLARPLTINKGRVALLSWGGSIFEYLFPNLFLPNYPNSFLWETYRTVVLGHSDFAGENNVPWGISESSYGLLNKDGHYRYKLHGIPDFGLKKFSYKDLVVAPYAVFLSMEIFPRLAYQNIMRLEEEGAVGVYGFYEAMDYTNYLSGPIVERSIKTFLCHHQGISIVAITNLLNDFSIRRRLSSTAIIKAHLSLLQERIAEGVVSPFLDPTMSVDISEERSLGVELTRRANSRVVKLRSTPQFNLLSNRRYCVYLDDRGGGFSKYQNIMLTNWISDPTFDYWGNFIYLKDLGNNSVWSATLAPTQSMPEKYEVEFAKNYAKISRSSYGIKTELEIVVPFDVDVEIRYLTIKNNSARKRFLELTNYTEIVLDEPMVARTHPVFSKMRVISEYLADSRTLFFHRLAKPLQEIPVFASRVVSDRGVLGLKFDTERLKVLGRAGSVKLPVAVVESRRLRGSTGPTLDPVVCWNTTITLKPHSMQRICYLYASADSKESALNSLGKYKNLDAIKNIIELTRNSLVKTGLVPVNDRIAQQLLTCLMYGREFSNTHYGLAVIEKLIKPELSIDWNLPTIAVRVRENVSVDFLNQVFNICYTMASIGVKFNLVLLVKDNDNYFQMTQNAVLETIDRFEIMSVGNNLASPMISVVKVDNFSPNEIKFIAVTSSLILDSTGKNIAAQINSKFNKI